MSGDEENCGDEPLREEDVLREDRLDDRVEEGAELPSKEEDADE